MFPKRFTIIVEDGKTIESDSLTLAYNYFADYCIETKFKSATVLDNLKGVGWDISATNL